MNFDLSDEQKMLAREARALLAERSPPARLRALIDGGDEWDEALWRQFSGMGFLGATIPVEAGGLGMTELDLGVISEELGRANAALPFSSSIVLAAGAIALCGTVAQQQAWLPRLASGEVVATLACAEGPGGWFGGAVRAQLVDGRLRGVKTPVADSGVAGLAVVLCRHGDGLALALVELDQPGVRRERRPGFDELRAHGALHFDDARAERLGDGGRDTAGLVAQLFDRAAVQAAFEAVGAANACLDMARDYAMERRIFGRPLGGFQAIKHRLADLAVAIELARSNAYYAAWAADAAPGELPAAAAAARLTALAAFEMGARENLQIHGGIGYTFETDCHFYYRRERTLAVSLGPRQYWADRLLSSVQATAGKAA